MYKRLQSQSGSSASSAASGGHHLMDNPDVRSNDFGSSPTLSIEFLLMQLSREIVFRRVLMMFVTVAFICVLMGVINTTGLPHTMESNPDSEFVLNLIHPQWSCDALALRPESDLGIITENDEDDSNLLLLALHVCDSFLDSGTQRGSKETVKSSTVGFSVEHYPESGWYYGVLSLVYIAVLGAALLLEKQPLLADTGILDGASDETASNFSFPSSLTSGSCNCLVDWNLACSLANRYSSTVSSY